MENFIISTETKNYSINMNDNKLNEWYNEVINSLTETWDSDVFDLLSILLFIIKKSQNQNLDDMIFGLDRLSFSLKHLTLNSTMLQKLKACIVIKETSKTGIKYSDKNIQLIKDKLQHQGKPIQQSPNLKECHGMKIDFDEIEKSNEILDSIKKRSRNVKPSVLGKDFYEKMEQLRIEESRSYSKMLSDHTLYRKK